MGRRVGEQKRGRTISGTIVISLDAELAWGTHDLEPATPADQRRERGPSRNIRRTFGALAGGEFLSRTHQPTPEELVAGRDSWLALLDAFDEFEIPTTWAIVGHLFLDECDGEHATHPLAGEWFANDPGGTAASHPAWFGDGLIEEIASREIDHEIASHSFSHVDFGADETTTEVASAELEACIEAADAHDITLSSFVFPRNELGHRTLLADHGFTSYRGLPSRWYEGVPLRPVAKLANTVFDAAAPPVSHPTPDEYGLVDIPMSLSLFSFEGVARSAVEPITTNPVLRRVASGIDAAIQEDGVFHLWFHPEDVHTAARLERTRRALAYIAARRERDDVTVETMQSVAERVS